jgi:DNA-binding NarL/FixJ family response regulator
MRPPNRKLGEERFSNHLRMPSGRSFYHRRPARYATEKKEFQRLIEKLNRLAFERGYSKKQIATQLGVSPITVSHWLTGYSLMAQRESIERLKKFLATHV